MKLLLGGIYKYLNHNRVNIVEKIEMLKLSFEKRQPENNNALCASNSEKVMMIIILIKKGKEIEK